MSLFTAPAVADIRDDSRLRPEQVSPTTTSDAMNTDIELRLPSEISLVDLPVLTRLGGVEFPFTDEAIAIAHPGTDADTMRSTLDTAGTRVYKLYALADLFDSSGQLGSPYRERAKELRAEADKLLEMLLNAVGFIADQQPGTTTPTETERPQSWTGEAIAVW